MIILTWAFRLSRLLAFSFWLLKTYTSNNLKNYKHIKGGQPRLLIAWLFMPLLLMAYACEEDDAEPEPERTITTKWFASGDQVAPLFRAYPLEVDSIYLELVQHDPRVLEDTLYWYFYIEKYDFNESPSQPIRTITGTDEKGAQIIKKPTLFDDVFFFETLDARRNDNQVTVKGLYQVNGDKDDPLMTLEYVYTSGVSGWPEPPDPEAGFGSTENGAYGDNNIHMFTKIKNDNEE